MKKVCALFMVSFLLGMIHTVSGQSLPEPASVIPLYEGVAPGSENWDWEENTAVSYRGLPIVQNVGKHGFLEKGGGADHFMDRLQEWMKLNGWLNKEQ